MVRIKKADKKTKKPRVKIIHKYEEDGKTFKSSAMLKYYQELKEMKKLKLIKNFEIPTIKKQTAEMKINKLNNVKIMIDDHVFPSILESKFYIYLKKNQKELNIKEFNIQVTFELQPKFKKGNKVIRAITYTPDFEITYKTGSKLYVDTKGKMTEEFKLKQKMFNYKYPELILVCLNYDVKNDKWYDIEAEKKNKRKKK